MRGRENDPRFVNYPLTLCDDNYSRCLLGIWYTIMYNEIDLAKLSGLRITVVVGLDHLELMLAKGTGGT